MLWWIWRTSVHREGSGTRLTYHDLSGNCKVGMLMDAAAEDLCPHLDVQSQGLLPLASRALIYNDQNKDMTEGSESTSTSNYVPSHIEIRP